MSVSSKILKVTKSNLRDNELPSESLQRIPAGSNISLSSTMIEMLAHMKHAGTIVIPKYGFTIKNGWLYCDKNQTTYSKTLWKILKEVPWIIGLSVGLLTDLKESVSFCVDLKKKEKELQSNLKHLVIYEKIDAYCKEGYSPILRSIIKDNANSLVSFCADRFIDSALIFSSLQYLKIRTYEHSTYYLSCFPKLMILDVPREAVKFPYIFSNTSGIHVKSIGSENSKTWAFATRNLKRHRAKVYTFVKFTPLLGKDVARMLSRMVEAIPATEWKLCEEDIPDKHRHPDAIKHIPDVTDSESILLLEKSKEYNRIVACSRTYNFSLESKQKKLKKLETKIVELSDNVDKYKSLLETWAPQTNLLIQQFLNQ